MPRRPTAFWARLCPPAPTSGTTTHNVTSPSGSRRGRAPRGIRRCTLRRGSPLLLEAEHGLVDGHRRSPLPVVVDLQHPVDDADALGPFAYLGDVAFGRLRLGPFARFDFGPGRPVQVGVHVYVLLTSVLPRLNRIARSAGPAAENQVPMSLERSLVSPLAAPLRRLGDDAPPHREPTPKPTPLWPRVGRRGGRYEASPTGPPASSSDGEAPGSSPTHLRDEPRRRG